MKYILLVIALAGVSLGTYWWLQPRPDCGAVVVNTGKCLEQANLVDCSRNVYSIEVCPVGTKK